MRCAIISFRAPTPTPTTAAGRRPRRRVRFRIESSLSYMSLYKFAGHPFVVLFSVRHSTEQSNEKLVEIRAHRLLLYPGNYVTVTGRKKKSTRPRPRVLHTLWRNYMTYARCSAELGSVLDIPTSCMKHKSYVVEDNSFVSNRWILLQTLQQSIAVDDWEKKRIVGNQR
jgi:hypothetical protein